MPPHPPPSNSSWGLAGLGAFSPKYNVSGTFPWFRARVPVVGIGAATPGFVCLRHVLAGMENYIFHENTRLVIYNILRMYVSWGEDMPTRVRADIILVFLHS